MPMPVLPTIEVKAMVMEMLNVAKTTYGTFDGTALYKQDIINEAVMQADIEVCKLIMRTPGHPRRLEYQLQRTISTPGVSVSIRDTHHHVGGLVRVDITRNDAQVVVGKTAPAQKITQWLLDKPSYGGDDCIDGYYDYTEESFIFTGLSAVITLLNVGTHTTSDVNLYAPFEYKEAVANRALVFVLKKDTAKSGALEKFENAWLANVQEITGINPNPPNDVEYKKAR